jgi:hypothetical protein
LDRSKLLLRQALLGFLVRLMYLYLLIGKFKCLAYAFASHEGLSRLL